MLYLIDYKDQRSCFFVSNEFQKNILCGGFRLSYFTKLSAVLGISMFNCIIYTFIYTLKRFNLWLYRLRGLCKNCLCHVPCGMDFYSKAGLIVMQF